MGSDSYSCQYPLGRPMALAGRGLRRGPRSAWVVFLGVFVMGMQSLANAPTALESGTTVKVNVDGSALLGYTLAIKADGQLRYTPNTGQSITTGYQYSAKSSSSGVLRFSHGIQNTNPYQYILTSHALTLNFASATAGTHTDYRETTINAVPQSPLTLTGSFTFAAGASPVLSSVAVSGPVQVNEGSTASYTCTASYTDGSAADVTDSAVWLENSSHASFSGKGLFSAGLVSSNQSCTITASYTAGGVVKSGTYTVTILDDGGGATPSSPQDVSASDGTYSSRIRVTWNGQSGCYYRVYRSNGSLPSTVMDWAAAVSFDDYNVVAGTLYTYYVQAASSATGSNASGSSTDTGYAGTLASSSPAAPSGVSASYGTYADRVHVAWNAASGATHYRVYRSTSTSASATRTALGTWQSGTSYSDTSAVAGTTYYYWAKAATSSSGANASSYSSTYGTGMRAAVAGTATLSFSSAAGSKTTYVGDGSNTNKVIEATLSSKPSWISSIRIQGYQVTSTGSVCVAKTERVSVAVAVTENSLPQDRAWSFSVRVRCLPDDNTYTIHVQQDGHVEIGPPDLAPYAPDGWDGAIVVSSVEGTTTQGPALAPDHNLFVDFCWANLGEADAGVYRVSVYVDEQLHGTWEDTSGIGALKAKAVYDEAIGKLAAGNHTITVVLDTDGQIAESDETNNVYIAAITVSAPLPLSAATVSNVHFAQRAGTRLVDIGYDLSLTGALAADVVVSVEVAGSAVSATGLSGDVGSGIVEGTDRSVVWDMTADWSGRQSDDVRISVSAVPGTGGAAYPVAYLVVDLSAGAAATTYPVTELDSLPDPIPAEYKTTKLVLRRIPAGIFAMGSPAGEAGRDSNETQHTVALAHDLYMGVFEVTQCQWELVMGSNPSDFDSGNPEDSYGALDALRPVEAVSYDDIRGTGAGSGWPGDSRVDAGSFLGRLRARTDFAFDLPTEAQWEYACRAGTTTALNSGKDLTVTSEHCPELDAVAWFSDNAFALLWSDPHAEKEGTQPVGNKLPNAWGLYDMHGNAWEWCLDWYGADLGTATVADPMGPSSGLYRVLRGGRWIGDANRCRSASRDRVAADNSYGSQGLRLCCPVPQP